MGPRESDDTFWNRDEHETRFVDLRPVVHSWSRLARRKNVKDISRSDNAQEDSKPLFEARLKISSMDAPDRDPLRREASPSRPARDRSERSHTVHLIWIRGQDRTVINTFWAYLSRKMIERTSGTMN